MSDANPRRTRRRVARFAALGTALLLLVTAVYASTSRGFETLWLPLARRLLDAEVTAASGRLDLRGRLEVRGLAVAGDAFELDLAHGVLEVSPFAIPPWRRPLVEELRLESGRLTILETDAAPERAEEEAEAEGDGLPPRLRPIPVRVLHASLRDLVVEGRAASDDDAGKDGAPAPARWRVGVAQARVEDVRPGSDGTISLDTRWRLPGEEGVLRQGGLVLDVALREPTREGDGPEADAPGDGEAESGPREGGERSAGPSAPVALGVRLDLRAGPPDASPVPLHLTATGRGDLDARGRVRLEMLDAEAVERGTDLGVLRASGVLEPFAGRADLEVEVDAAPAGPLLGWIPLPDALVPLLAPSEAA
ncbi:MAG: hypothetical protein R3263_09225, partial [Myxococcota bacterium]|nr:hypothetical protein [Myxococcota bacterium]